MYPFYDQTKKNPEEKIHKDSIFLYQRPIIRIDSNLKLFWSERSEGIKEDVNSTKLARKKTKEKQTEELLYQYGEGFPSLLESKGTRFVDSQNVLRFVFSPLIL